MKDYERYIDFIIDVEEENEVRVLQLTDTQIIDASQRRYETRLNEKERVLWAPEKMEELLHTAPGSASVLGLFHDKDNRVQLVIDKEVLLGEYIGCHPLVNTSSLRLATRDLQSVILPATGHTPIDVDLPRHEKD